MHKLTEVEIEAIAYIFEQRNGNKMSDLELLTIDRSETLPMLVTRNLMELLINHIEGNHADLIEDSTSAYWALSKTYDPNLIPSFQKWLRHEVKTKNSASIYQILIALSYLEKGVFSRCSTSYDEVELNMRDATKYLEREIKSQNDL